MAGTYAKNLQIYNNMTLTTLAAPAATGLTLKSNLAAGDAGTDFKLIAVGNRTAGKVLSIQENNGGTELMSMDHAGAIGVSGAITSSVAASSNAIVLQSQARISMNASGTSYIYENASGEIAFFVAGGERLRVTGGTVKVSGYEATTQATGYSLGDPGSNGCRITCGTGTPEGAVTARIGSLFLRLDGGATTTLYVKTSGTGNTGWTAK